MESMSIKIQLMDERLIIAATFAISALLMAIPMLFRAKGKVATQLFGVLLIVAISFSSNNPYVYIISVFVIATLVTELSFLEKIAALMWNRKEYWSYKAGTASKNELEKKAEAEAELEIQEAETEGPDEIEIIDSNSTEELAGINEVREPAPQIRNRHDLMKKALEFEATVLDSLESNAIPFKYDKFQKEIRITYGSKNYIFDGIIETKDVHYLIEIKYITRPSSLVNAIRQIKKYKAIYESYLSERNQNVTVQPIIIIPETVNMSGQFRGIPIVKFDDSSKTFSNLKASYADYELSFIENDPKKNLRLLLIQFLKQHSKWAFSPLRIQKWGAKQIGYEKFAIYTVREIRKNLQNLLEEGIVEERTSKKGNRLYKIKL